VSTEPSPAPSTPRGPYRSSVDEAAEPGWVSPVHPGRAWRLGHFGRPRRIAAVIYAAGAATYLVTAHFPPSLDATFLLIAVGLLVGSIGENPRSVWLRLVIDWLPLFLLLNVYDLLRKDVADVAGAHLFPQLHADEWLFGGTVPTVMLQHALFTPADPHWWDYLTFLVYLSHFVVPIGVAAVLWKFAYRRFRRYAVLFLGLTFAAFATYALYPAVPPWLASLHGALSPTTKVIDDIWIHLGARSAASVLSSNSHLANPVAAMPSLHAAYPFLLMLFFWRSAGRYRWLLPLYPLAMGFTLVYSAEHFVIDILAGWLYATVVFIVGNWAFDRWVNRRSRNADTNSAATRRPTQDRQTIRPRVDVADR
jgi:hypothetical protein